MLNHREWVETQTRKIQTEQKQEVYLRDIITLLKKKFPNCEVYTSDKTSTTYGSNGYSVKRYGHCNVIVKYPNGSYILYDLCSASQGDLSFKGAYDSEYEKAEYNEKHFTELFKKQNDDS